MAGLTALLFHRLIDPRELGRDNLPTALVLNVNRGVAQRSINNNWFLQPLNVSFQCQPTDQRG